MIQSFNTFNTGGAKIQESQSSVVDRKFVDLSDGVNDAVEISLLPFVDTLLVNQAQDCTKGKKMSVHNEVYHLEAGEYKKILNMDYGMKMNKEGSLVTQGKMEDLQNGKVIFLKEKGSPDALNAFNVTGSLSADKDSKEQNEHLQVKSKMNGYELVSDYDGNVNGEKITQHYGVGLFPLSPSGKMEGNLAGVSYNREGHLSPFDPNFKMEGTFDGKPELTHMENDGNSMNIERTFGDYKIMQNIKVK